MRFPLSRAGGSEPVAARQSNSRRVRRPPRGNQRFRYPGSSPESGRAAALYAGPAGARSCVAQRLWHSGWTCLDPFLDAATSCMRSVAVQAKLGSSQSALPIHVCLIQQVKGNAVNFSPAAAAPRGWVLLSPVVVVWVPEGSASLLPAAREGSGIFSGAGPTGPGRPLGGCDLLSSASVQFIFISNNRGQKFRSRC